MMKTLVDGKVIAIGQLKSNPLKKTCWIYNKDSKVWRIGYSGPFEGLQVYLKKIKRNAQRNAREQVLKDCGLVESIGSKIYETKRS